MFLSVTIISTLWTCLHAHMKQYKECCPLGRGECIGRNPTFSIYFLGFSNFSSFFFCSFIRAYMSRARPGQGPRLNLNLENSLAITTEIHANGLSLPALLWLSEFLHNMPFPTFFPLCLMFLYFLRCCRIVETANCGQWSHHPFLPQLRKKISMK